MSLAVSLTINLIALVLVAVWLRHLIVRRVDRARLLGDLQDEVAGLATELNRAGDHNISILEDRIAQLRTVVAVADRQIEELTRLVERTDEHALSHRPDHDAPAADVADAADERAAESDEESGRPSDIAPAVRTDRDRVAELFVQGKTGESIAAETGIAIGEVELMISLLQRRVRR